MSKSDNTIKRIVMTVDQFYKHDEQDEQYAYGLICLPMNQFAYE